MPNPVNESAVIKYAYDGIIPRQIILSLYDIKGNKIRTISEGRINPGEYTTELNTALLTSGSYRLTLESGGKVISYPLVITK
jgi:hypothetical protein